MQSGLFSQRMHKDIAKPFLRSSFIVIIVVQINYSTTPQHRISDAQSLCPQNGSEAVLWELLLALLAKNHRSIDETSISIWL